MCYLHAVDILRVFGQDVLTNYRAGLPRRKQQQQQQPQQQQAAAAGAAEKPNTESGDQQKQQHGVESSTPQLPRAYMHRLIKEFINSGRHYTSPKKRLQPGPYSPF
ncbi:hypothetical protein DQ04_06791000 [Trypanosoma grayi]|uniref:hypothetical protein n=1 Tax=Trypanosoma grayi TaxID=71804 RepID=UPI0004F3F222|nr:hypothetical protein DQ04_06791000 [Trypanosoma grayi]KEG08621.1 hypothetical protein DQ04_06791000 [Trypanosoma grayi]